MPALARLRALVLLAAVSFGASGCKKPYRVGEFVLIENEEGVGYPAYITEKTGKTHYRVHYDGFDCDQEVSLERIQGRIEGPAPAPPSKPPCGSAIAPAASNSHEPIVPAAAYKPGDRVRVTWRGSVYTASVVQV